MSDALNSFRLRSPPESYLAGWVLLTGAAAVLVLLLDASDRLFEPRRAGIILGLGAVALWRYAWQITHLSRALLFLLRVYPRWRRAAVDAASATHVYVLVLSYRMGNDLNAAVYAALLRDLADYGRPATVVACVSDLADARQLSASGAAPANVRVLPLQQSNRGKRDAMERGLDVLARLHAPPGSVVALIDGDTFVPAGTFRSAIPMLLSSPGVGALTTENIPIVTGGVLEREWFRLRMRARHYLMCSMSLSRRVLVLTGRFSLFRAELALSRGFILTLGDDVLRHWRLGDISMLTGDDKSTWFWALRRGWHMIYLPDVVVYCMERPPRPTFFDSTRSLMRRYYGNMARNNGRALALGPGRIGWFTWLAIFDQRVSPWTTLVGPTLVVWLSFAGTPSALPAYLLWAILVRALQTGILGGLSGLGGGFHPLFPFIQYYNQVLGSYIKIDAFFHLDKQSWTRQKTGGALAGAMNLHSSVVLMVLSLGAFALAVGLVAVHGFG